jgi:hypothetical protein
MQLYIYGRQPSSSPLQDSLAIVLSDTQEAIRFVETMQSTPVVVFSGKHDIEPIS